MTNDSLHEVHQGGYMVSSHDLRHHAARHRRRLHAPGLVLLPGACMRAQMYMLARGLLLARPEAVS